MIQFCASIEYNTLKDFTFFDALENHQKTDPTIVDVQYYCFGIPNSNNEKIIDNYLPYVFNIIIDLPFWELPPNGSDLSKPEYQYLKDLQKVTIKPTVLAEAAYTTVSALLFQNNTFDNLFAELSKNLVFCSQGFEDTTMVSNKSNHETNKAIILDLIKTVILDKELLLKEMLKIGIFNRKKYEKGHESREFFIKTVKIPAVQDISNNTITEIDFKVYLEVSTWNTQDFRLTIKCRVNYEFFDDFLDQKKYPLISFYYDFSECGVFKVYDTGTVETTSKLELLEEYRENAQKLEEERQAQEQKETAQKDEENLIKKNQERTNLILYKSSEKTKEEIKNFQVIDNKTQDERTDLRKNNLSPLIKVFSFLIILGLIGYFIEYCFKTLSEDEKDETFEAKLQEDFLFCENGEDFYTNFEKTNYGFNL